MLKALNPKLALIVGEKASIVFQHICYWMQTQKVETVYRTNKELSSDLEGMFSEQQIQRAKKKLIDNGIITVSFDKKNVWNRTTHYTLTEKGKAFILNLSLANRSNDSSEDKPKQGNHKGEVSNKPQRLANKPKSTQTKSDLPDYGLMHNSSMKASFEEGFANPNATKGIPSEALSKLNSLFGKKKEVEPVVDDEWLRVIADESDMIFDDEYSESDYNECDIAMINSFNSPVVNQEKQLSMSELVKKAFTKGVSNAQQKMYDMQCDMNNFKEDF